MYSNITYIHIHALMAMAAMQGAEHQEQFGVQYLAPRHFLHADQGISLSLYCWSNKSRILRE